MIEVAVGIAIKGFFSIPASSYDISYEQYVYRETE
jgi:hypothetical protein